MNTCSPAPAGAAASAKLPRRMGKYRGYTGKDLALTGMIRRAQAVGFTLAEMKQLVAHKARYDGFPLEIANALIQLKQAELCRGTSRPQLHRGALGRVQREGSAVLGVMSWKYHHEFHGSGQRRRFRNVLRNSRRCGGRRAERLLAQAGLSRSRNSQLPDVPAAENLVPLRSGQDSCKYVQGQGGGLQIMSTARILPLPFSLRRC